MTHPPGLSRAPDFPCLDRVGRLKRPNAPTCHIWFIGAFLDEHWVNVITPKEILKHVGAEPFRPFRIRMTSGVVHEIHHPEMIKVGASVFMVFKFVSEPADIFDDWDSVSHVLIESISFLDSRAA